MPQPVRHARDRAPTVSIARSIARALGAGVLSLGLLAVLACQPQENGEGVEEDTTELEPSGVEEGRIGDPPGERSRPGTTRAAAEAPAGETVQVSLMEFGIDMPATLPAGETVFAVTNDGSMRHNFEVEGQGTERELERDLEPGESDTLRVELEPGTYQVYCPVEDHEERGMSMELRVSPEEA